MTEATAWRFEAIGTGWHIDTPAPLTEQERSVVTATVTAFDAEWSRFRDDSVVSRLGASGGAVSAPPDADAMLRAFAELSRATEGAVNPLVGASLERLGYDASYSLRAGRPVAAPPAWSRLLTWDDDELRLEEPGTIDVGALGKGRLVDLVAEAIPGPAVVDAGGDMIARGAPLRVALEHPYDARRAIGVITIENEALCASASNRRAWGDGLHHVLDARTGAPVDTVVATWAIAPTAMIADAAATALFFDGGPAYAHAHDVHWVRMLSDGRAQWTLGDRLANGTAEVFR